MKQIGMMMLVVLSVPSTLWAHDGSAHISTAWYQDPTYLALLAGVVLLGILGAVAVYYTPYTTQVGVGLGVTGLVFGVVGWQTMQPTNTPVTESVTASLAHVPATVYRTEGCTCCGGYAKELTSAGAAVTTETISPSEMQTLKASHGITDDQASCHTSIIDGYVVEGHVPFAAIAQLLDTRPSVSGIALPGMPIGTPGMPGRQTETYTVSTLNNELFWQSS